MLVEDLGSDSCIFGHLADYRDSNLIVRSDRDHLRPGRWSRSASIPRICMFGADSGLRVDG